MCDADQTDGWVHAGTEIGIDRGSDSQASCSFIDITVCIDNVLYVFIISHLFCQMDVRGFVGCMKVFLYLCFYICKAHPQISTYPSHDAIARHVLSAHQDVTARCQPRLFAGALPILMGAWLHKTARALMEISPRQLSHK